MDKYVNFNEERSKQLLCLDAMDLRLLPTTYQPWFEDDLLWSSNAFLPDTKHYFEFVIKSKFDNDNEPTEETTHTICYICNTTIPKAYVFEHVNSSKHIAYQKIAETGIERARKHKQLIGSEQLKNSLEYFCEHCVSVIYLCNKNEHEKSKIHKNHAAFDTFLDNFALFYTTTETGDILESLIADCEQDSNDISLLKVNAKDADVKKNEDLGVLFKMNCNNENIAIEKDTLDLENKLKDSKLLINTLESCLDNHKEVNNNVAEDEYEKADIVNNLRQYITRLKTYGSVKLYTLDSLNEDRVKIVTCDGVELIVSTFNFHGLKKIGKYLQCKLCECIIKNPIDHRLHEKHMKIVAQPFEDKHCIRHIKGTLSHCVLCNEVIDNIIVHTQFNKHVKKIEQALVPIKNVCEKSNTVNIEVNDATSINIEKDFPELPKLHLNVTDNIKEIKFETYKQDPETCTIKHISENQCRCLVCNIEMHTNNVENHLNGTKHKMNSKSGYFYLMDRDKNRNLTCKVCAISVNYYTWAVQDHIASTNHIENYNKHLATNKIDKTGNTFLCKPCGKKIFLMDELSHIENQSHKVKLASYNITFIDRNNHVKDVENKNFEVDIIDEALNKYIIEEPNSIGINHVDAEKNCTDSGEEITDNQTNEVNNSNLKNNNKVSSNDYAHESEISSNVNEFESLNEIPNSDINVRNDNAKHKTMDVLLTGVNNLLEELLKYFNSPPEIHSHLQMTDVENVLNCIVCNDKVTIENTEKHTNSLKHIYKHRKLMIANKLKFKQDKYVCYACNVYVETGKELRHIDTVEHEKRIESLKNGDYVLISADNKKLIDEVHNILEVTDSEPEKKAKNITFGDFIPNSNANNIPNVKHHYIDLIDNQNQLICLFCQVLVQNVENEYREHTTNVDHEIKYKTVMNYNQIFQVEDGFVCGFCECIISNEFEHISSEKHIMSQKNYPKKNYCFTCKVSTIDIGLKEHVTNESHIKNIEAPSYFYCNICNSQIPTHNIGRHNESFEHQNNSSLIGENKVILKNKNGVCLVCEITFNRGDLEDHLNSLNHIMLLHHNYYRPTSDN